MFFREDFEEGLSNVSQAMRNAKALYVSIVFVSKTWYHRKEILAASLENLLFAYLQKQRPRTAAQ